MAAESETRVNALRSRWTLLQWLKEHLNALIPLDQIAKPTAVKLAEVRQALAADPELFLVIDRALKDTS